MRNQTFPAAPFLFCAALLFTYAHAVETQWQQPRFLAQGAYSPQEIQATGPHVVVSAHTWGPEISKTGHDGLYILYRSPDQGQNWSEAARQCDPIESVSINERGQLAWLSGRREPKQRWIETLNWNTLGEKSAPIWNFTGGELGMSAELARVPGGHWVFAQQGALKTYKGVNGPDAQFPECKKIRIAFGADGTCPKEVSTVESAEETGLLAWATSVRQAGFITTQQKWQALAHYSTQDAGKTWSSKLIPFVYAAPKNGKLEQFVPLHLARDGQRLLLAVEAQFLTRKGSHAPDAPQNPKDSFYQHFLLQSNDLGATWSAPIVLTKPNVEFPETNITSVLLSGPTLYVAMVSQNKKHETFTAQAGSGTIQGNGTDNPFNGGFPGIAGAGTETSTVGGSAFATADGGGGSGVNASWTSSTTSVLASKDGGKTWDAQSLEKMESHSSAALLTGSGTDMHLTLFYEPNPIEAHLEGAHGEKLHHKAEQYLVVRSRAKW